MEVVPHRFFNEEDEALVKAAIASAEKNTSGEIRLHLEPYCKIEVLDRAADIFGFLKMHETSERNGVLFYLAYEDHKFAILGDAGINAKVPEGFWDTVRDTVISHFKSKAYAEGLSKGIEMAGEKLKTHFPYHDSDKNELSDDISYH